MKEIKGKVLITTDWHLGLKNNSKNRLAIVVNVVKNLIAKIKDDKIENLIFAGDLFHVRTSLDVNVINVAYKLISTLAKYCHLYLICGNHDSYLKNSIDINSLNMFKSMSNVDIIDVSTEISINGNKSLLVPWLGDLQQYSAETFDMMFGHFDVSSKYLMKSYIAEHSANNISSSLKSKINNEFSENIGDLVGDFVDVVKQNGIIFSGHIHGRKEFISKGRKFILIGDPYQQNLGEKEYDCGYYVIDETNSYKFYPITNVPKHIELKISSILKDIDNFDFSIVKGNIIHKVYDCDISVQDDAKITQYINDWHPYEELLPDYDVNLNLTSDITLQNESIELIKKSKMEYVRNYISNIDSKLIEEQNIDRERLYKLIEEHYNKVVEEK